MTNDISTPFKYDCPGKTWIQVFVKHSKLPLKNTAMIYFNKSLISRIRL